MFNDINYYLEGIKEKYQHQVDKANQAYQQIQEWNKDTEIQKYKETVKYIRNHSLFIMSDKEFKADKEFREQHYKMCAEPLHSKTAGNTYIYELTGTGLGTCITITCPICGQSKDITDTDSW